MERGFTPRLSHLLTCSFRYGLLCIALDMVLGGQANWRPSTEAIDLMFRAMVNEGDEVLIPQPSYVSYEPCAILADARPVIIDLKEENEFRLTAQELEDSCRTYIDLEAVAEVIIKHDLYVLSDEIYAELTYSGEHVSIASLPGMQERTILVNGFSKAYAMTGWRLGYACGPAWIMDQMTKIHQFAIMCAPTTSQYAAVEALRNGDEDVAAMRESYNERRRFVVHTLREMGLPCFEPLGAFYVFPCIKSTGLTSEEFCERLIKSKRVAVVPGDAFGECGEGYIRVSYCYSIDNIREAIRLIGEFVKEIKNDSNS